MDKQSRENKYQVINSAILIRCYNRNRNTLHLTSYPLWIKKHVGKISIIILLILSMVFAGFDINKTVFVIISSICIASIVIFYKYKISDRLKNKFKNSYGLKINNSRFWTDTMTVKVRKARLKNVIGKHIENEELINRIKIQLSEEITNNKKSLYTGIPIAGFITIIIANYISFNLRMIEVKSGGLKNEFFTKGEDFIFNISLSIISTLLILILYKPFLETMINGYHKRLSDLLKTIQTIEIEYLNTKTK